MAAEKKCVLADLNADMQVALKAPEYPGRRLTSDGVHMNPFGRPHDGGRDLESVRIERSTLKKANEHWYNAKTCPVNTGWRYRCDNTSNLGTWPTAKTLPYRI